MNIGFIILIVILCVLWIGLLVKLFFFKKALREIEKSFQFILESDTNHLITTASTDQTVRNFVAKLNEELIELRRQKLEYQNGNQELKKVITNISHDLRTPLTAITGYLDFMQQEPLTKNQIRYLEIIQQKSEELTELTGQLFDFSKTMDLSGKMEKERCCINTILEETLLSYYTILKEKKIVPEVRICEKKIEKDVHKNSVVRIFENILSNLVKYSEKTFRVELQENGVLTFSNRASSLDETTVQKIFDRYFSVENAKESTGIGLSIAKQLVELNGGTITAQYQKGYLTIQIKW